MKKLRPYQEKFKRDVYASLRENHRVMAQLPTGGGKSVIAASIIQDAVTQAGKRAMIMVHRNELVHQLADKIQELGIYVQFITAGSSQRYSSSVYVASVQTLSRRIEKPPADVIIIDEAHHATAKTYRDIIECYPAAKVIGITATPCRTNGKGFDDIFEDLILGPDIKSLVGEGFLVPCRIFAKPVRGAELRAIKSTGGDFNQGALAQFMERSVVYGDLVDAWQKNASGKKTIVFAASVELSKRYVEEYQKHGVTAEHLDGETPERERSMIMERFRMGDIQVLSNCSLFGEGLDVPDVECVQIVRPTKSLALYLQMVGRAMRPAAGKPHAIILDHGNCWEFHGIPEEHREWTLEGVKKDKGAKREPFKMIDEDGEEMYSIDKKRELKHDTTYELVPITEADVEKIRGVEEQDIPLEVRDLSRLISIVELNHYKTKEGKFNYMWAWKKYTATRRPTPMAITWFRKRANYHPNWESHQMRGFGYDLTRAMQRQNALIEKNLQSFKKAISTPL